MPPRRLGLKPGVRVVIEGPGKLLPRFPIDLYGAQGRRRLDAEVIDRAAGFRDGRAGGVFPRPNDGLAGRWVDDHALGDMNVDGAECGLQIECRITGPVSAEVQVYITRDAPHFDVLNMCVTESLRRERRRADLEVQLLEWHGVRCVEGDRRVHLAPV